MKQLKQAIPERLLPWFAASRRSMPWREERTPYRVWISELMLQQTRVDQVVPYFNRFLERFPDVRALADAPLEDVLKMWEGLGYYARARNLHRAAQTVSNDWNGRLPQSYEQLLRLPGIGPYTAAAIGSLAFNLDLAVLDGNVSRVLSRLRAYPGDVRSSKAKRELQRAAEELLPRGRAADYNEAMMELGATLCQPRTPRCADCPLAPECIARKSGSPADYPVKAPRKKVPHLIVGAAVVVDRKGRVLVAQRREKDMLGGLWEFPGGKQESGETIQQCIARELEEELGIRVEVGERLVTVRHAYSHFTMDLHAHFAKIRSGRPRPIECQDFQWLEISNLRKRPYSKADLKIIDALEQLPP